jgi:hypothetical protein
VRQKEGDSDGRLIAGREPFIGEEADRPELQTLGLKLSPELPNTELEVGPGDADVEVADPQSEEVVVGERLPRDLGLAAGQDSLHAPDRAISADRRC